MEGFYLREISPKYYDSILSYRKEMIDHHDSFDGCASLENYEDAQKWHLNAKLFEKKETVPPLYSIGFEYLYADEENVAGMVNLRPEAASHPYLMKYGGHIGYSVRPSMRNQGIATDMLKEALVLCKETYGLERVMISCNENNEASRRVILNNGGVFDNKILYPPEDIMIERYWINL